MSFLINGCYRCYHQDLLRKRCVDVDTPDSDSSVEVDTPIPSTEIPVSDPEPEVPMNVSPGESSPPVTDPPSENTDKRQALSRQSNLVLHPILSRNRIRPELGNLLFGTNRHGEVYDFDFHCVHAFPQFLNCLFHCVTVIIKLSLVVAVLM